MEKIKVKVKERMPFSKFPNYAEGYINGYLVDKDGVNCAIVVVNSDIEAIPLSNLNVKWK